MIRPVGPKDSSGEFPVTKAPSKAAGVSKVAQGKLQKAIFKRAEFKAEKKISNREEAKTTEDVAFDFFEGINESNAK
ncbi:MAG TPA: hypothetical protein VHK67_04830 [Rhabdochlamydiaceae bacterium]|jgi:hypothetical protein|nr:hypothetical protein [Rhabdochlamydiaceae bacterium]